MQCPECKSTHINKNGKKKGKQNYITYMTRVEGENTRLRHYLARLKRKTLCYSKSQVMLKHSLRLLIHYLKFRDVHVPYIKEFSPI